MMTLERACPTAAHWTDQQYQRLLAVGGSGPQRLVLVAEAAPRPVSDQKAPGSANRLLALLVARHVAPEWELENIVVSPETRRKGLGKRLLDALLARARDTKSHSVFLEVRASNSAARALYEKAGFHQTGRRKAYYADPQEDAVLYRRSLP